MKTLAVGFRDLVQRIREKFEELPHYGQFTSTNAVDSEISEKKHEVMMADLLLLVIQAQTDLQSIE